MRTRLDALYGGALWIAGLCLAAIAVLVGLQVGARIVDGALKLLGLGHFDFVILSLAEIAGYLLAAATFFALAPTLKAGTHIRVTMLLVNLPDRTRRAFEIWALAAAAIASAWMTARIALLALDSWRFNEVSVGMLPIPLAIPQAAMAVGSAVLTITLLDELVIVARGGRPSFQDAEDAPTLGKEG